MIGDAAVKKANVDAIGAKIGRNKEEVVEIAKRTVA